MYTEIKHCRICGNSNLTKVLDLGQQALSGHFPRPDQKVDHAPLQLVKCAETSENVCGLLQLAHTYDLDEMYGRNYGYRSSLNASMINHLRGHVQRLENLVELSQHDIVIDIGSNDGTLLKQYSNHKLNLFGVDPTIEKFGEYYPDRIQKFADFFPSPCLADAIGEKKVKIITSIAMFYDLEKPCQFVEAIAKHLAPDGVWLFEQSYMPTMIKNTSYDTICHEHLEYYGLRQIRWMLDRAGLQIIDVRLTDANGGSFAIVAAHQSCQRFQVSKLAEQMCEDEVNLGFQTMAPYQDFSERVFAHREELTRAIRALNRQGKRVIGYGASTKGNVILQFCGLTPNDIISIFEVNEDKFGCVTPGSEIPIVQEQVSSLGANDILVPLPWHFRSFFESKLKEFLERGGGILFPLPQIELLTRAPAELEL